MANISVKEIAKYIGAEIQGDAELSIEKIASLTVAQANQLTFALPGKNTEQVKNSQAGAIIIAADMADLASGQTRLVAKNPHLAFAKACELFKTHQSIAHNIHSSAVIGENCNIADSVSIAAHVVVGNNVTIGEHSKIHANTVIGDNCHLGKHCELKSNVSFAHECCIGDHGLIHEGTVIGSDGFGNTKEGEAWYKIPQLGRVIIGNNVEIGANSAIDRGALEDTILADGVRIDNLVHLAHNVYVGEHSAIAAQGVIAGGVKIGRHCMMSGNVGITDHLTICDGAIFTGMAMVTNSIKTPGVYSSGTGILPNTEWRKMVVHLRNLNKVMGPLKKLLKQFTGSKAQ